jgi:hypothetical protein
MHVSGVRGVRDGVDGLLVDVIAVNAVDVAVVEEVHVIPVRNGRVPAEAVMDMRVLAMGLMRAGPGHRYLRPPR